MRPEEPELEDGERQARLSKWMPWLWIAPLLLILLLAAVAYFGR